MLTVGIIGCALATNVALLSQTPGAEYSALYILFPLGAVLIYGLSIFRPKGSTENSNEWKSCRILAGILLEILSFSMLYNLFTQMTSDSTDWLCTLLGLLFLPAIYIAFLGRITKKKIYSAPASAVLIFMIIYCTEISGLLSSIDIHWIIAIAFLGSMIAPAGIELIRGKQ